MALSEIIRISIVHVAAIASLTAPRIHRRPRLQPSRLPSTQKAQQTSVCRGEKLASAKSTLFCRHKARWLRQQHHRPSNGRRMRDRRTKFMNIGRRLLPDLTDSCLLQQKRPMPPWAGICLTKRAASLSAMRRAYHTVQAMDGNAAAEAFRCRLAASRWTSSW